MLSAAALGASGAIGIGSCSAARAGSSIDSYTLM
jgi:hypothetical protein